MRPAHSHHAQPSAEAEGLKLLGRSGCGCISLVLGVSLATFLLALARPVAEEMREARGTLRALSNASEAEVKRSWWEIDLHDTALGTGTNWRGFAQADLCVEFHARATPSPSGYCQRIEPLGDSSLRTYLSDWGPALPWIDPQGHPAVSLYLTPGAEAWLSSHAARAVELPDWLPEATALEALQLEIDAPLDRVHSSWAHRGLVRTRTSQDDPSLQMSARQQDLLRPQVDLPSFLPWIALAFPLLLAAGSARGLPLPFLVRLPASVALAFACFVAAPLLHHVPGPPGVLVRELSGMLAGQVVGAARIKPLTSSRVVAGELREPTLVWTPESSTDAELLAAIDLQALPASPPASDLETLRLLAARLETRVELLDEAALEELVLPLTEGALADRTQLEIALVPALAAVGRRSATPATRNAQERTLELLASRYLRLANDDYWGARVEALVVPYVGGGR